ncbi:hypothetical protein T12_11990 [Trichinella patagoniensis]|uniref:Uncharacterized protein n=1 Tax=Trichinella patagoniensis TaxID=990121 RepID=A0A0V1A8F8_9BILA|nr:hypothetical protein T12_11990 [Trichinella patagoniensis]
MDYIINIELHSPAWLNGVTQYCSRNLCGFAYRIFVEYYVSSIFTAIRNHVDKYVITKHYYQLMPLSLATYIKRQGSYGVKISITVKVEGNPRRRLRLCPRANKNLHIPVGYAEGVLLHSYPHGIPYAPASLILEFHTYLFSTYLITPHSFSVLHSA